MLLSRSCTLSSVYPSTPPDAFFPLCICICPLRRILLPVCLPPPIQVCLSMCVPAFIHPGAAFHECTCLHLSRCIFHVCTCLYLSRCIFPCVYLPPHTEMIHSIFVPFHSLRCVVCLCTCFQFENLSILSLSYSL